jgi:hypothetical protein
MAVWRSTNKNARQSTYAPQAEAYYYSDGPISPVAENWHSCFIEGTKVICNYIWCDFEEEAPTVDDAKVIAEVHTNQEG